MIAGVRPFYSADEARELMRRLMEAPDPLKRHRDGVPVALERVVMKALAREPADRWQGVGEMGEGLGSSVSVRAPARSRRWWRIAAAAAAVVTVTVATTIALRDDDRTSAFRRDSDGRVHLADFAIVALLPPRPAAVADSVPTIVNRLAASI
jgi:serine/threonine-protein kinase